MMNANEVQCRTAEDELKRVRERIVNRYWELVAEVGNPMCSSARQAFDKGAEAFEAYAMGARNSLQCLAEDFEVFTDGYRSGPSLWDQVVAALGEATYRKQCLDNNNLVATNFCAAPVKRRMFVNLLLKVRAKRVAMRDDYEGLDLKTELFAWLDQVSRMDRECRDQAEAMELQRVGLEVRALGEFFHFLQTDEGWRKRNWEKLAAQKKQAA